MTYRPGAHLLTPKERAARDARAKRNTALVLVLAFVITMLLAFGGGPALNFYECGQICEAQGAARNWTFTQGCFCADERGAYNPKDERKADK